MTAHTFGGLPTGDSHTMSATQTFERNESGLSDSTHSSASSSAERYRLDEQDSRLILLYNYRGTLQTSTPKDVCARLDKGKPHCHRVTDWTLTSADENLRCTKKLIPRGTSHVEIKRHDLYLPDEKELYSEYPNYDSSLASIKVPTLAYWSRMFFGSYDELYIVSPESSPNSSRRASPTNTWGPDGQGDDARSGAEDESA